MAGLAPPFRSSGGELTNRLDHTENEDMKTIKTLSFASILGLLAVAGASAQSIGVTGNVTTIRTGWSDDAFAVVTTAEIRNPASCPTPDGYISHRDFPGYDTFYAAALRAFETNAVVDVVISDTQCFAGRPVLIGINLYR